MPSVDFLYYNPKDGWRLVQDIYEQICYILKRFRSIDKINDLPFHSDENYNVINNYRDEPMVNVEGKNILEYTTSGILRDGDGNRI